MSRRSARRAPVVVPLCLSVLVVVAALVAVVVPTHAADLVVGPTLPFTTANYPETYCTIVYYCSIALASYTSPIDSALKEVRVFTYDAESGRTITIRVMTPSNPSDLLASTWSLVTPPAGYTNKAIIPGQSWAGRELKVYDLRDLDPPIFMRTGEYLVLQGVNMGASLTTETTVTAPMISQFPFGAAPTESHVFRELFTIYSPSIEYVLGTIVPPTPTPLLVSSGAAAPFDTTTLTVALPVELAATKTFTVTVTCGTGHVACGNGAAPSVSCATPKTCAYTFGPSAGVTPAGSSFNIAYTARGEIGSTDECTYVITGANTGKFAAPAAPSKVYVGSVSDVFVSGWPADGRIKTAASIPLTVTPEWAPPTGTLTLDVTCTGPALIDGTLSTKPLTFASGVAVTPVIFNYQPTSADVDTNTPVTVTCTYALSGADALRYVTPSPTRFTLGSDSVVSAAITASTVGGFLITGPGLSSASPLALGAGGHSDSILIRPTKAVSAGEWIQLSLVCTHSTQKRMTAVFTPTSGLAQQVLSYRAPLQCGVTDACRWVMTGSSEVEIAKFVLPVWDSTKFAAVVPAKTVRQAWKNKIELQAPEN